jgi:hypothetical protein
MHAHTTHATALAAVGAAAAIAFDGHAAAVRADQPVVVAPAARTVRPAPAGARGRDVPEAAEHRTRPPVARGPATRAAAAPAVRAARPARRRVVAPRPLAVGRVPVARPPAPAGPTSWPELNRAIARIPNYHGTGARWVVFADDGHWGTVDWSLSAVYVSPRVPLGRLYDVVVHEWSHLLSVRPYGGDVHRALAAMNAYFGGSDLTGAERAADCMAVLQGAAWTHYTSCQDGRWRVGAARLLRGAVL